MTTNEMQAALDRLIEDAAVFAGDDLEALGREIMDAGNGQGRLLVHHARDGRVFVQDLGRWGDILDWQGTIGGALKGDAQ